MESHTQDNKTKESTSSAQSGTPQKTPSADSSSAKNASHRMAQCTCARQLGAAIVGVVIVVVGVYALMVKKQTYDLRTLFADPLAQVDAVDPENAEQFGYALGVTLGDQAAQVLTQFDEEGQPDVDTIVRGVRDVLSERELVLSDDQIAEVLEERGKIEQERSAADAQASQEASEQFVAQYAQQEGVQQTEGGTLYTVQESGSGPAVGAEGQVMIRYRGMLVDGMEFDSSYSRGEDPVPFDVSAVIPGFGEALALMRAGDTWEVVIPAEQAYGAQGIPGVIGPHEALIFEVDVVEITG